MVSGAAGVDEGVETQGPGGDFSPIRGKGLGISRFGLTQPISGSMMSIVRGEQRFRSRLDL